MLIIFLTRIINFFFFQKIYKFECFITNFSGPINRHKKVMWMCAGGDCDGKHGWGPGAPLSYRGKNGDKLSNKSVIYEQTGRVFEERC